MLPSCRMAAVQVEEWRFSNEHVKLTYQVEKKDHNHLSCINTTEAKQISHLCARCLLACHLLLLAGRMLLLTHVKHAHLLVNTPVSANALSSRVNIHILVIQVLSVDNISNAWWRVSFVIFLKVPQTCIKMSPKFQLSSFSKVSILWSPQG